MPSAAELLAAACTSGILCLSEKNLLVAIAQGASVGGGGGGGGGTLSTDGTFAANSDLLYPSQKAAKTYIDAAVAGVGGAYVLKAGDTMTGLLTINAATALVTSGNVGIGISPNYKLQVKAAADKNLAVSTGASGPAGSVTVVSVNDANTLLIPLEYSALSHTFTTGNVGIGTGTTAPVSTLEVASPAGGANTGIKLTQKTENGATSASYLPIDFSVPTSGTIGQFLATANNYASGALNVGANSVALLSTAAAGTVAILAGGASGDIRLNTGGFALANERLRITSAGAVGIGISVPLARLHITPAASGTDYFRIDHSDGTPRIQIGALTGSITYGALWFGDIVPSATNYGLASDGGTLRVGSPLAIPSGSNQRAGNATLVGGTLTVLNTTVTANTLIFLTRKTTGGTIGFAVTYTVIAATSFTITSDNVLDTSTYSYILVENP